MKKNPTISKNKYYVNELGEISWKKLKELASNREITPSNEIFVGRTSKWVSANNIPTLFSNSDKWLSCPKCSGKAFGGRGCFIIGVIIITFPIGLLFLLIKPTYTCHDCGYRFQV